MLNIIIQETKINHITTSLTNTRPTTHFFRKTRTDHKIFNAKIQPFIKYSEKEEAQAQRVILNRNLGI